MNDHVSSPYIVLGVPADATTEVVRSAYLALVRQYPPDRSPDKFREIHAAYTLLNDPLEQARAIFRDDNIRPNLLEVISAGEQHRPRLPHLVLLALGNQE